MAANPVVLRRQKSHGRTQPTHSSHSRTAVILPLSLTILVIALAFKYTSPRRWILSGTAVESLLLMYGYLRGTPVLPELHLWIVLATLNLTYALVSNTWVLYLAFTAACYVAVLYSCLSEFSLLSSFARKTLRQATHPAHFIQDKIAFFNLPALAIDTEINGLFVVRGITLSLSNLVIEAHGIELGLKLDDQTELAVCLDYATIRLFRRIEMGNVYANLKLDNREQKFPEREEKSIHDDQHDTHSAKPLLQPTPKVLNDRYGASSRSNGSTGSDHTTPTTVVPLDDAEAERRYYEAQDHISTSSQIDKARQQLKEADSSMQPQDETEMRQMICAKLQDVPSVSHTPEQAVSAHVLQTIFPRLRKFLHRLPFLLRLILSLLSHLHPINFPFIVIAGPGKEAERLFEKHVIHDNAQLNADKKELEDNISSWLGSANFCLEIGDLNALSHVPLRSAGDITIYLRSTNVGLYRTTLEAGTTTLVTHIGGADLTMVIPAFLLPHHEHRLPPTSAGQSKDIPESQGTGGGAALPPSNHTESSQQSDSDHTEIALSIHASLPTYFDQSLLDIGAALVKALEIIDLANLLEQESKAANTDHEDQMAKDDSESRDMQGREDSRNTAGDPSQDGGHGTAKEASTSLTGRARRSVKESLKKGVQNNALGDKLNDRWIAKTLGRIAARLEQAKGDFGYTTALPVSLQPYRPLAAIPSKLLP